MNPVSFLEMSASDLDSGTCQINLTTWADHPLVQCSDLLSSAWLLSPITNHGVHIPYSVLGNKEFMNGLLKTYKPSSSLNMDSTAVRG
jgi:hypothetical protein